MTLARCNDIFSGVFGRDLGSMTNVLGAPLRGVADFRSRMLWRGGSIPTPSSSFGCLACNEGREPSFSSFCDRLYEAGFCENTMSEAHKGILQKTETECRDERVECKEPDEKQKP